MKGHALPCFVAGLLFPERATMFLLLDTLPAPPSCSTIVLIALATGGVLLWERARRRTLVALLDRAAPGTLLLDRVRRRRTLLVVRHPHPDLEARPVARTRGRDDADHRRRGGRRGPGPIAGRER